MPKTKAWVVLDGLPVARKKLNSILCQHKLESISSVRCKIFYAVFLIMQFKNLPAYDKYWPKILHIQ